MSKSNFVFLLGLNHSGKDTVGQMFIDKGYTRVAFGDVLKEEYAASKGISVDILHIQGPEKEAHRDAIIEFAEAKRAVDSIYWIRKAIAPYVDETNTFKRGLKLVFTDIRRMSEVNWISSFKNVEYIASNVEEGMMNCDIHAKLFLIERPNIVDNDMLSHETIGYTKGMQYMSDYTILDAIIGNDGTMEDLKIKIENCIKAFSL